MDGTSELFSDFIAALPRELEITAAHYPTGLGLSYAELERFVCDICPISEAFVLLAESYSTPAAISYAAANPANLKGLILCAGFAMSPVKGWLRILSWLVAPVIFAIPLPDLAAKRWLVGSDAPPSLLIAVRAAVASVQPSVLVERLRALLVCDVRAAAAEIAVPTLYIRAEQDHLVGSSCSEELRRINPRIGIVPLQGPHLLLQRHPLVAAETVLAFVRLRCALYPLPN